MTIIVVSGLPPKWDMKITVRKLSRKVKGQFEALTIRCFKNERKCYVRLSEMLNPEQVVSNINTAMFGSIKLHAYIPDEVPYFPRSIKPKGIPFKLRRALRIPNESTHGEVLYTSHTELLEEMQIKYIGLYNLSLKEDHALLRKMSRILLDRLWSIVKNSKVEDTAFKLTTAYRKHHPHINDFQFIVSTLHSIEEALGKPLTQLNKKDFLKADSPPHLIANLPYDKIQATCKKCIDKITKAVVTHAKNLNTEPISQPSIEQAATLRVREELKKLVPHFPLIIMQVIKDNFSSQRSAFYKIRVYGEPYMPTRDAMAPFLKRYRATKIYRSDRTHNLLCCKVPIAMLAAMLAADGTVVSNSTLFVRLADAHFYKVPESMKNEMLSFNTSRVHPAESGTRMEDEWNENW